MPELSYSQSGLVLRKGDTPDLGQIRDLQADLRRLGYLHSGIDGRFGPGTERAVKALQCDLLLNDGRSTGSDGQSPVRLLDYNRGRVARVNGQVDQALVACISDLLDDAAYPKLPRTADPRASNRQFIDGLSQLTSATVPIPFLLAIFKQESGLKHFNEPRAGDDDTFIVVGLDTNSSNKDRITSRGYGAGQYTLFHHPPSSAEVQDCMLDPARNVQRAMRELSEKFEQFVLGDTSGTQASDRLAELGAKPLTSCKYGKDDPRYLKDCRKCALAAGLTEIKSGTTPLYAGSSHTYEPTQYYKSASYSGVPVRSLIGCDWPYAARRYNGAGINSYHYQARILKNLALG